MRRKQVEKSLTVSIKSNHCNAILLISLLACLKLYAYLNLYNMKIHFTHMSSLAAWPDLANKLIHMDLKSYSGWE